VCVCAFFEYIVGRRRFDEKRRLIRMSNSTFKADVLQCAGGRDFLESVGFEEKQYGYDHQIALDPEAHTYMTLPMTPQLDAQLDLLRRSRLTAQPAPPGSRCVDRGYAALDMALRSLQSASASLPPLPDRIAMSTFDPFKSHITSLSAAPRAAGTRDASFSLLSQHNTCARQECRRLRRANSRPCSSKR
jgi:hypothetical protein